MILLNKTNVFRVRVVSLELWFSKLSYDAKFCLHYYFQPTTLHRSKHTNWNYYQFSTRRQIFKKVFSFYRYTSALFENANQIFKSKAEQDFPSKWYFWARNRGKISESHLLYRKNSLNLTHSKKTPLIIILCWENFARRSRIDSCRRIFFITTKSTTKETLYYHVPFATGDFQGYGAPIMNSTDN